MGEKSSTSKRFIEYVFLLLI